MIRSASRPPMNPLDLVKHGPVIPVIVLQRVEDAVRLAEALLAGGVTGSVRHAMGHSLTSGLKIGRSVTI